METLNYQTTSSEISGFSALYQTVPAQQVSVVQTNFNTIAGANGQTLFESIDTKITNNNSSFTAVAAASGGWNSTETTVNSTSANWSSVYTSVNNTSGDWSSVFTSVNSTSGNWDSVYTSVNSTSGNWGSVFTSVNSTSGEWNSTKTTVTDTSANWSSTYATVCANSAVWLSQTGDYLPLSGGTLTGDLSSTSNITIDGILTAANININNSTIVETVTGTGIYMTLTVNGSALAVPLYRY